MLTRLTGYSAVRYVLVGGGAFAIDAGCFYLLRDLGEFSLYEANLASRTLGALATFFGNRHFSFAATRTTAGPNIIRDGLRYGLLFAVNYLASTFGIILVLGRIHELGNPVIEVVTKILIEAAIVIFSFLCQRFWVFR